MGQRSQSSSDEEPGKPAYKANQDLLQKVKANIGNKDRVGVPPLNQDRVAYLAKHGITMTEVVPMGARVEGMDLRKKPSEEILAVLQEEMAERGFLVFGG